MIVSRYITITQGNIDNQHIYLRDCLELFPDDVFGGTDESQIAPRTVCVEYGSSVVETDIDREKGIFRRRGWVREFFADTRATAGDRILLEQLTPYRYRVCKVNASH
ncbi:hypothetical protein [Tuwongella immobilis]|nr:hypothetical protein [Tuwongella immobilis]